MTKEETKEMLPYLAALVEGMGLEVTGNDTRQFWKTSLWMDVDDEFGVIVPKYTDERCTVKYTYRIKE